MPIRYLDEVPPTADLVIVGGGVVGAATAFAASRAGLRPLILERRPALATLTTAAAAGGFRLQLDDERELGFIRESVELFLHFTDATGQVEFDPRVRQPGYLWLTATDDGADRQRRLVERQRSWGLGDVELLSGEEVRRRFPFVAPIVTQARFRQGDGVFEPRQVALGLCAGAGATVVTGCEVEAVETGAGGRVAGVRTARGTVSTGAVVVAGGPFSGLLAATAGVALPIVTVKRQKVVLPDAPDVPPDAPMTIDEDTGTHWRPVLGGASVLLTDPATPPTPPAEDPPVEQAFAFRLLDPASDVAAARLAPFFRRVWERGAAWMIQAGQYTITPDRAPLIGPTPVEGLHVNTGCDGHGVMRSVAAGRLLVDVLTGRVPSSDNPYRLDRTFVERPRLDAL